MNGGVYLKLFEMYTSDTVPELRVAYMQLYRGTYKLFTIWDRPKQEFTHIFKCAQYEEGKPVPHDVYRFKPMTLRDIYAWITKR